MYETVNSLALKNKPEQFYEKSNVIESGDKITD